MDNVLRNVGMLAALIASYQVLIMCLNLYSLSILRVMQNRTRKANVFDSMRADRLATWLTMLPFAKGLRSSFILLALSSMLWWYGFATLFMLSAIASVLMGLMATGRNNFGAMIYIKFWATDAQGFGQGQEFPIHPWLRMRVSSPELRVNDYV